ncbi:hypothetical protein BpHYR1_032232 [Brachionus plicatilis]|uniref:Uncharacterized protein n=1 Tax=Brachionus plicatilis TaxID=10195 RepID=A0A3M7TAP5_BRAPC|nr:hypothetical protein BpHYR1_032232 [Brachionus plicatilis]
MSSFASHVGELSAVIIFFQKIAAEILHYMRNFLIHLPEKCVLEKYFLEKCWNPRLSRTNRATTILLLVCQKPHYPFKQCCSIQVLFTVIIQNRSDFISKVYITTGNILLNSNHSNFGRNSEHCSQEAATSKSGLLHKIRKRTNEMLMRIRLNLICVKLSSIISKL